ncbi:MAG: hypothetical protein H0W88_12270 [Parachlamydiaceae bacterium]|nr:hypothetical protein [Parachlamydiaceae bacterium]
MRPCQYISNGFYSAGKFCYEAVVGTTRNPNATPVVLKSWELNGLRQKNYDISLLQIDKDLIWEVYDKTQNEKNRFPCDFNKCFSRKGWLYSKLIGIKYLSLRSRIKCLIKHCSIYSVGTNQNTNIIQSVFLKYHPIPIQRAAIRPPIRARAPAITLLKTWNYNHNLLRVSRVTLFKKNDSLNWEIYNTQTNTITRFPCNFSECISVEDQVDFLKKDLKLSIKEVYASDQLKELQFNYTSALLTLIKGQLHGKIGLDINAINPDGLETIYHVVDRDAFIQIGRFLYLEENNPIQFGISRLYHPIDLNLYLTMDQKLKYLTTSHISIVKQDKNIIELRQYRYSRIKSKLDQFSPLSEDRWGVTLVDTGTSYIKNPKTWKGHAVLMFEGVKNGQYFMKRAHMTAGGVDCEDIRGDPDEYVKKFVKSRTRTWLRDRPYIEAMFYWIDLEEKKKVYIPAFSIGGENGFLAKQPTHNCTSWAREKLALANVMLKDLTGILYVDPVSYTSFPEYQGNESVIIKVQIVFIKCDCTKVLKYNVEDEVRKFKKNLNWYVEDASRLQFRATLKDITKVATNRSYYNCDINGKVIVRMQSFVGGKRLYDSIDLTKFINDKIKSEGDIQNLVGKHDNDICQI